MLFRRRKQHLGMGFECSESREIIRSLPSHAFFGTLSRISRLATRDYTAQAHLNDLEDYEAHREDHECYVGLVLAVSFETSAPPKPAPCSWRN